MRDYGKVHSTFWSSKTIRALSEDGRTLAMYLLTCSHSTIAGVFRLPDGYVCEDLNPVLGWSSERVEKGFSELFAKGFANRCGTSKWVWVVAHFEWNSLDNPNQRKAAKKIALSVPDDCAWRADFIRKCGPKFDMTEQEIANCCATVPKPFANQDLDLNLDLKQKQKQDARERECAGEQLPEENGEQPPRPPAYDPATDHAAFDRVKAAYPKFAGRQDWINAQLACHNRIDQDGQTWDKLIAAAERYARFIRAKGSEGTQFVMSPGKFFSAVDRPWAQDWLIPTAQGVASAKPETPAEREWRRLRAEASSSGFHRAPREGESLEQYRAALQEHDRAESARTMRHLSETVAKLQAVGA